MPCAICAKPTSLMQASAMGRVAEVVGLAWGDGSGALRAAPDYLGAYPVGPDCHRRFLVRT